MLDKGVPKVPHEEARAQAFTKEVALAQSQESKSGAPLCRPN